MGKLYFGDNIDVLRDHVRDESVDLIYLDPPFNSNANYGLLFKDPSGVAARAQAEAFRDTWEWGESAELAFDDLMRERGDIALLLRSFRSWMGENAMMAYLAMMSVRLVEMRRKLKPTGSLFLHCDPKASHYLKILLDAVFGHENFRNELVWKRKAGRGETQHKAVKFGTSHDTILFYSMSENASLFRQYRPSNPAYIASKFTHFDSSGRRYRLDNITSPSLRPNLRYHYKGHSPPRNGWAVSLERMKEMDAQGRLYLPDNKAQRIQRKRFLDELPGETVDDLWDDISPINSQAKERLGYPTQKPIALLERIIAAATKEGDVVLDPFCGCGTSVEAAERMRRQWIGIDVTHYAVTLIEARLKANHPEADYTVHGRPVDLESARDLARRDKHQFQWWAAWRLGSQTYREERRGPDRGIDGNIYFKNGPYGDGRIIVSVKGGASVGVEAVRELGFVVDREQAQMGVLISLADPSKTARQEAAASGFVAKSAHGKLPRVQCVTVADMLAGRMPHLPPLPQPERVLRTPARKRKDPNQLELLLPFSGEQLAPRSGGFVDPRFIQLPIETKAKAQAAADGLKRPKRVATRRKSN